MSRLKRYATAWSRHHRSAGFGIHSPHAYHLVTGVLRERAPYYAYASLAQLRRQVIEQRGLRWPYRTIIRHRTGKLLFRLANHFGAGRILQLGTIHGLTTAYLLAPSSSSRAMVYDSRPEVFGEHRTTLGPVADRIEVTDDLRLGIERYTAQLSACSLSPFVLVNALNDSIEAELLQTAAQKWMQGNCVMVVRHIHRNRHVRQLWDDLCRSLQHGQTFSNDKTGIIVANPKLQREDFYLWF